VQLIGFARVITMHNNNGRIPHGTCT
jgi:hypothetical protein